MLRTPLASRLARAVSALSLLLLCCHAPAAAQPSGEPALSLLTFGQGGQVHQYFGHNALLVEYPGRRRARIYNYGMFSFGPDMIPRFLKGRLMFWVGITDLGPTLRRYAAQGRSVSRVELNLDAVQKRSILSQLEHDVLPAHRDYLYDHYYDNCSTRLRDLLDRAVGGQLRRAWAEPSEFNLRQHTRRYTRQDVLIEWLMTFGLNDQVDQPMPVWDEMFLPLELEKRVLAAQVVDGSGQRVPLALGKQLLHQPSRPRPPAALERRWPQTLGAGLLLGGLALALSRRSRRGFGIVATLAGLGFGSLGTLLASMWAFSDHTVTYGNENLLLANPLSLGAGFLGLLCLRQRRASSRPLAWTWSSVAGAGLLWLLLRAVVPSLDQDVSLTATLLLPLNLGIALGAWRALGLRDGAHASTPAARARPGPARRPGVEHRAGA